MSFLYTFLQRLWRIVPPTTKEWVRTSAVLNTIKRSIGRQAGRLDPHNVIYNDSYYVGIERNAQRSKRVIVEHVVRYFHPKCVLDVGCGSGAFLEELQARDIEVLGLEYSEAAVAICRAKKIPVLRCDLENEQPSLARVFDVVLSTEVAEHLPESCASRYIDLLCSAGRHIVFTAAVPGQTGDDHVNPQPNEYWIQMFTERGFDYLAPLSLEWRKSWEAQGVCDFYCANLMLFQPKPEL